MELTDACINGTRGFTLLFHPKHVSNPRVVTSNLNVDQLTFGWFSYRKLCNLRITASKREFVWFES